MSGHLDRPTTWLPEKQVLIALAECLQMVKITGDHRGHPTCQFIKPKHCLFGAAIRRLTGHK